MLLGRSGKDLRLRRARVSRGVRRARPDAAGGVEFHSRETEGDHCSNHRYVAGVYPRCHGIVAVMLAELAAGCGGGRQEPPVHGRGAKGEKER